MWMCLSLLAVRCPAPLHHLIHICFGFVNNNLKCTRWSYSSIKVYVNTRKMIPNTRTHFGDHFIMFRRCFFNFLLDKNDDKWSCCCWYCRVCPNIICCLRKRCAIIEINISLFFHLIRCNFHKYSIFLRLKQILFRYLTAELIFVASGKRQDEFTAIRRDAKMLQKKSCQSKGHKSGEWKNNNTSCVNTMMKGVKLALRTNRGNVTVPNIFYSSTWTTYSTHRAVFLQIKQHS